MTQVVILVEERVFQRDKRPDLQRNAPFLGTGMKEMNRGDTAV